MIYNDIKTVHGPYLGKDNRYRVVLVKYDNTKKTVSYPKYLIEKHLDRYLNEDETVDHINKDTTDNRIENLRVISRSQHAKNDVTRNADVMVTCAYCGKQFKIEGKKITQYNRRNSGYFCSRLCSGRYGVEIQQQKRKKVYTNNVSIIKFSLHEA